MVAGGVASPLISGAGNTFGGSFFTGASDPEAQPTE